MGLSGHPHTLPTLCLGKEPLGPIHHEALCSQNQVLMSFEQKDVIHYVVFLQVQSMGSNGGGVGGHSAVNFSYLPLIWPSG
jgi:hypothetical protein